MTNPSGFVLHPEAAQDILEIWEFVAAENPSAARRVREEILQTIRSLVAFPQQGFERPDLTGGRSAFRSSATT